MGVLTSGAGSGGLELVTRLSDGLGDDVEVTLIDQGEGFVFGFSKLESLAGGIGGAADGLRGARHHVAAGLVGA